MSIKSKLLKLKEKLPTIGKVNFSFQNKEYKFMFVKNKLLQSSVNYLLDYRIFSEYFIFFCLLLLPINTLFPVLPFYYIFIFLFFLVSFYVLIDFLKLQKKKISITSNFFLLFFNKNFYLNYIFIRKFLVILFINLVSSWFVNNSDIVITLNYYLWEFLCTLVLFLSFLLPVLISVAFYTLAERKIMALLQRRVGPNVVGFWGLLQAAADGLKLILKEIIVPSTSHKAMFLFAPILSMVLAFGAWSVIPFGPNSVLINMNYGVLFLFMLSGLNVYSMILAGWGSNSSFALLACLRSIAQMISYEVSFGLCILPVLMLTQSANLIEIVLAQSVIFNFWPLLPWSIIFFISLLAETNRAPFDLPEAEAELVAGYNVEYSSSTFALFFLAEYSNMLVGSAFWAILFWGGWLPIFSILSFIPTSLWFGIKIAFLSFIFIFVRALLPRYRYDQLMDLGWKIFLPFSLLGVLLTSTILIYSGAGLDPTLFENWISVYNS